MREKISACVITYNEERNIRRCLESIKWCDEIVIVDSFSTDRTLEICREYTATIYQHEWEGYIGQRNYIRKKASHGWVLHIDADEELSPQLTRNIQREIARKDNVIAGYQFPRLVRYLNKWIRFGDWYPDIKLRLFRQGLGRSVGTEPHDYVVVDGPVKTIRHPIHHYTYDSIKDHLQTINRFTEIAAETHWENGGRFHLADLVFRPPWRFIRCYIFKGGFLCGRHGFLIAIINSFSVALKYAKFWEIEVIRGRNEGGRKKRGSQK